MISFQSFDELKGSQLTIIGSKFSYLYFAVSTNAKISWKEGNTFEFMGIWSVSFFTTNELLQYGQYMIDIFFHF